MLAAALIGMQKEELGKVILRATEVMQPQLCSKVAGMILTLENPEILHIMQSGEQFLSALVRAKKDLDAASRQQQGVPQWT